MEHQHVTGATLMKKKVIGFAVFGLVLATVGGIGSAVYFPKAEKQSRTSIDERYQVKQNNKNLELSIKGNIDYRFTESSDQDIHISGKAHSVMSEQRFTWKPVESGDKTLVEVAFTETGEYQNYIQLGFSQFVTIAIPTSFESITINGDKDSNVNISDLKTADLVLNIDSHDYTHLSNLTLDNLTVTAKAGSVSLDNIKAQEKVSLKGDQGYFSLYDSRAESFTVESVDGQVDLNDLTGDSTVKTEGGFVTLASLKGKTSVETIDGYIDWEDSKLTDDLQVKTTSGNIRINLERRPNNFTITTKSNNGTVRLFGKEKKSLKKGSGGPTLTLESLHGDIRVDDEDSEYDEYTDDDFDETLDDVENEITNAIENNF